MAAHAQVAQSPLYQAAQQQAADLREQLASKQRERLDLDLKLADAQHRMHVQDRQVHLPGDLAQALCRAGTMDQPLHDETCTLPFGFGHMQEDVGTTSTIALSHTWSYLT